MGQSVLAILHNFASSVHLNFSDPYPHLISGHRRACKTDMKLCFRAESPVQVEVGVNGKYGDRYRTLQW